MSETYSKLTTSLNSGLMYNGGLRTSNVRYIVVHHNATTNKDVAMNTWLTSSGNWTSAHYEITPNEIIGCVGENYVAYHAGGAGGNDVPKIANPNQVSIGLEHVNSTGKPSWGVADSTLRTSAKLIADICKRYGLPIDRSTIKMHREVTATACPGGLDIDKLVQYAQEASGQKTTSNSSSTNNSSVRDSKAIKEFKDAKGGFTMFKSFKVDEIKNVNGGWQMVNYNLAGGKDFDWTLNGIPLDLLDNVTRGNNSPTQKGDSMKFAEGWNKGTIDAYDAASNGIGIKYGDYGMIWFNADTALSL